jgi:tripeptide aminopeptidase
LPTNEWSPETTDGKAGFVHPLRVSGLAEQATVEWIIRDFDTARLMEHEERLKALSAEVVENYPGARMEFAITEQYRNMKEILDQHPKVSAYAADAYQRAGISLVNEPIRGGTDGSRLSFMGLPCPNIFTGMQAIHSKHEWIGVSDMEKAVTVLVTLAQVWEERG